MVAPVAREPDIFVREASGAGRGRTHALKPGCHTIGRDPQATVRLACEDVSRFHAALEVTPESLTVTDLDSKNGVLRAGAALTGPTRLGHGEVIVVGGISLQIHHPGAQIEAALQRGGEATVTRIQLPIRAATDAALTLPLAATLVVAALVGALLLWQ